MWVPTPKPARPPPGLLYDIVAKQDASIKYTRISKCIHFWTFGNSLEWFDRLIQSLRCMRCTTNDHVGKIAESITRTHHHNPSRIFSFFVCSRAIPRCPEIDIQICHIMNVMTKKSPL